VNARHIGARGVRWSRRSRLPKRDNGRDRDDRGGSEVFGSSP